MRISAAEFARQFGRRCDDALAQPVIITRNGHDRLILMSLTKYRELTERSDPPKQTLPENTAPQSAKSVRKGTGNGSPPPPRSLRKIA